MLVAFLPLVAVLASASPLVGRQETTTSVARPETTTTGGPSEATTTGDPHDITTTGGPHDTTTTGGPHDTTTTGGPHDTTTTGGPSGTATGSASPSADPSSAANSNGTTFPTIVPAPSNCTDACTIVTETWSKCAENSTLTGPYECDLFCPSDDMPKYNECFNCACHAGGDDAYDWTIYYAGISDNCANKGWASQSNPIFGAAGTPTNASEAAKNGEVPSADNSSSSPSSTHTPGSSPTAPPNNVDGSNGTDTTATADNGNGASGLAPGLLLAVASVASLLVL